MIKYNSSKNFNNISRYQNCRVIYNSDVDESYFEVLNNSIIDIKKSTH